MIERIKDKLWTLKDVLVEYPKVFYLTAIYIVLIVLSISIYFPILQWLVNFEMFFNYPFREIIISNFDTLRWGVFVLPLVIVFHAFFDVLELHERLEKRKYRR